MSHTQKINFFDESYSREICCVSEFGILDGDNEKNECAYLSFDITKKDVWEATVSNEEEKEVHFLPVDHNIPISRSDGKEAKRCDGILFSQKEEQQAIFFIELKNRKGKKDKRWREKGIEQLISTIKIFSSCHDIHKFNQREAFVCNRKMPFYQYGNLEELEKFKKKYHVSLNVSPSIKL